MWNDLWKLMRQSDVIMAVFLPAFVVFAIQTAAKFLTKLPVILNDPPRPAEIKAAKFDALCVGLDLTIIGLVGSFGVLGIASKYGGPVWAHTPDYFLLVFIGVQFVFILTTIFLTARWSSPQKGYWKGICIPSFIGLVSIFFAIAAYSVLAS